MGFFAREELEKMGFASLGIEVRISKKVSIYNPHLISIGNHVRIDDFAIISPTEATFKIGNYVHIAAHCMVIGREKITLSDFSGLSGRVTIYSSSDDYSGEFLTNPTVPEEFTNVQSAPVSLGRHVIVGAGSIILPNVDIGMASAISAMSLVTRNIPEEVIAAGIPCRVVKKRSSRLLDLEKRL